MPKLNKATLDALNTARVVLQNASTDPLPISPKRVEDLISKVTRRAPKGDIQKPGPKDFEAPLEKSVRKAEDLEDYASNLQGATALTEAGLGILGRTAPAAIGATNAVLQKANVPVMVGLTAIDAGRVSSSPEYRKALEGESARILESKAGDKTKQFRQDTEEMGRYLGRPVSAAKILADAAYNTGADLALTAEKTKEAEDRNLRLQRRLALLRSKSAPPYPGPLPENPKMDRLRDSKFRSKV